MPARCLPAGRPSTTAFTWRGAFSGWAGPARQGARLRSDLTRGMEINPTNRRSFRVYYDSGHCSRIAKTHTYKYWLVSDGYVSSGTTRRNRRRAIRVDLRGRHHHDEDHDPVAGVRHPRQRGPDRDRDPDP